MGSSIVGRVARLELAAPARPVRVVVSPDGLPDADLAAWAQAQHATASPMERLVVVTIADADGGAVHGQ